MRNTTSYLPLDDEEEDYGQPPWAASIGFGGGAPPQPANQYNALVPGNMDLTRRPYVRNGDGVSTVYSTSGADETPGFETLFPGVSQSGRLMSGTEAGDEYLRTGEHLGMYANPQEADAAGEAIHQDQMLHPPTDTLEGRGLQPGFRPSDMRQSPSAAEPDALELRQPEALTGRYEPEDMPSLRAQLQSADAPVEHSNRASPWAVVADLLLNRGRGLGQILTYNSAEANQDRELNRRYKEAQVNRLNNPQYGRPVDPRVLQMRERGLDLQAQRLDAASKREVSRAARDQRISEGKATDSDYMVKQLEARGFDVPDGASPEAIGRMMGMYNIEHRNELAPEAAADVARSKNKIEDEHAPQDAANAGARAKAVDEATGKLDPNTGARIPAPKAQAPVDPQTGQPALSPQEQRQREKMFADEADKFSKENKNELTAATDIIELQKLVDRYPKDIPNAGIGTAGMLGDLSNAWYRLQAAKNPNNRQALDARQLNRLRERIANAQQRTESGAAAPLLEAIGYRNRAAFEPGASEAEFRQGIQEVNDILRNRARGFAVGKEKAARGVLRTQGLESWAFGNAPEPAAAAPTAVQAQPIGPDDDDLLQGLGGRWR